MFACPLYRSQAVIGRQQIYKKLPPVLGGKIVNFTMVFNTVSCMNLKDIKFAKRIQQLFVRNFDIEENKLHIPEVFKKILNSEVMFETVTSDLA